MKKRRMLSFTSLAVALTLVLLSGCGGGGGSDPALPGETAARDTLTVAFTSETPSLTTYEHDSLIAVGLNNMTYNGLTRIDNATLKWELDLAESYTIENEVDWLFTLHKGVKFHNGDDLTSADVVATLNFIKDEVRGADTYTSNIESITAVDDYTVKITTKTPYAGLLYDLGFHFMYIMPKGPLEAGHDFNADPIGTGPYILSQWVYGDSITFVKNENYFDPAHEARIPNLKIVVIPEGASRAIALEVGEVDFVYEVGGADVANLQSNPDITVVAVESIDNVMLSLNTDVEPTSDVNFRRAIDHAINRQNIIDGALNGYGVPNASAISIGYAESTQENAPTYDLEKAQAFLDAWGGDPSEVTLEILCSNETRVAIATVIQGDLAKIGINVDVVPMDTATYFAKMNSGDYMAGILSWSPADALTFSGRFHSERRAGNPGKLNDAEVDELITLARAELDEAKRAELIGQIIARVNTLSPQPTLYQSVWFRAHHADLQNVICGGSGYASFQDMYWA